MSLYYKWFIDTERVMIWQKDKHHKPMRADLRFDIATVGCLEGVYTSRSLAVAFKKYKDDLIAKEKASALFAAEIKKYEQPEIKDLPASKGWRGVYLRKFRENEEVLKKVKETVECLSVYLKGFDEPNQNMLALSADPDVIFSPRSLI